MGIVVGEELAIPAIRLAAHEQMSFFKEDKGIVYGGKAGAIFRAFHFFLHVVNVKWAVKGVYGFQKGKTLLCSFEPVFLEIPFQNSFGFDVVFVICLHACYCSIRLTLFCSIVPKAAYLDNALSMADFKVTLLVLSRL